MTELLERLQKARFTGELTLRLTAGIIDSARLSHFLAREEFNKPLPTIDASETKAAKE